MAVYMSLRFRNPPTHCSLLSSHRGSEADGTQVFGPTARLYRMPCRSAMRTLNAVFCTSKRLILDPSVGIQLPVASPLGLSNTLRENRGIILARGPYNIFLYSYRRYGFPPKLSGETAFANAASCKTSDPEITTPAYTEYSYLA